MYLCFSEHVLLEYQHIEMALVMGKRGSESNKFGSIYLNQFLKFGVKFLIKELTINLYKRRFNI